MTSAAKFFWHVPRRISALLILSYQHTFSPDHGLPKKFFPYGYCKFYPSCSQYGIDALNKHGFVCGWLRALWRILRCNPLTRGGNDPA